MLQYVDSFACSWNQKTGNLVIHFMQKEPVIGEEDNISEITNPIASVIMDREGANALFSLMQEVREGDTITEDQKAD